MSIDVDVVARRFGLRATEAETFGLQRRDQTVRFGAPPTTQYGAWTTCLGVRLGLDLLAQSEPRGVGDLEWTQRLLPKSVVALAAQVAGRELHTEPWLGTPFCLAYTRESGKLLLAAAASESVNVDDARRALFYSAYKLRPSEQRLAGGRLRVFQTTGGLASSVASLMPDFDYDASRDHGVLAIPDFDRMLIFQPGDAPIPWAELRGALRSEVADAPLPFSRRLYSLRRDRIIPAEVCGPSADPAQSVANLLEVVA